MYAVLVSLSEAHNLDIKTWCPEVSEVTEKMGWVYFWTISNKMQQKLNLADQPGVKHPIKGLCGDERQRFDGKGATGFRGGKTRRGDGRPRRGEGGRLMEHDY